MSVGGHAHVQLQVHDERLGIVLLARPRTVMPSARIPDRKSARRSSLGALHLSSTVVLRAPPRPSSASARQVDPGRAAFELQHHDADSFAVAVRRMQLSGAQVFGDHRPDRVGRLLDEEMTAAGKQPERRRRHRLVQPLADERRENGSSSPHRISTGIPIRPQVRLAAGEPSAVDRSSNRKYAASAVGPDTAPRTPRRPPRGSRSRDAEPASCSCGPARRRAPRSAEARTRVRGPPARRRRATRRTRSRRAAPSPRPRRRRARATAQHRRRTDARPRRTDRSRDPATSSRMYPACARMSSGASCGFSESPDPSRSGTITRNRDASSGMNSRHSKLHRGKPCSSTTTGPSPASVYASSPPTSGTGRADPGTRLLRERSRTTSPRRSRRRPSRPEPSPSRRARARCRRPGRRTTPRRRPCPRRARRDRRLPRARR